MNTESQPITEAVPSIFKPTGRKPTGKIAQLPKNQRNIINQMLDDGATYDTIETEMAKHGVSLNGENISNWFQNGFQQYLQHQDHIAEMRLLRENASDLVQDYNVVEFHQAANQLAVGQIFKALTHHQLIDDPINYVRVLNALSRLSRAALVLKQSGDEDTKAAAQTIKSQPVHDPETQRRLLLAAFEGATGVKAAPGPIGPDLNERLSSEVPLTKEDGSGERGSPTSSLSASGGEGQGEVAASSSSNSTHATRNTQHVSPHPSDSSHVSHPSHSGHASRITSHDFSSIENRNSKFKNPRSPSTPDPRPSCAPPTDSTVQPFNDSTRPCEHCLECRSPLPPVPPHSLRRPDDHCPSCGGRLPDIGHCYQSGFDKCINCEATQPALLPGGERPRPYCHQCGLRLHNPEPT
jgi:hypothetical protein